MHRPKGLSLLAGFVTLAALTSGSGCGSGYECILGCFCGCSSDDDVVQSAIHTNDGCDLCDPNTVCGPCDPNVVCEACDPNAVCEQCDPNSVCDPNEICEGANDPQPDDDPNAVPTGYCEITGPQHATSAWSDPASPIVQFFEENGAELPGAGGSFMIPEGGRVFILLDESGVVAVSYDYEAANNRVLIWSDPVEPPIIGVIPSALPGGSGWLYTGTMPPDGDETLGNAVEVRLAILNGDLEEGRVLEGQITMAVTVYQDVPANPDTGRPAIPAGSSVSWTQTETHVIRSSESPFQLFPDAEFELGVHEEEETGPGYPVGYYEVTGPHEVNTGWDQPDSPLAQLIGEGVPTGFAGPGMRSFFLFDQLGTVAQVYDYEEAENSVTLHSVEENLLIGRPAEEVGGNEWAYTVDYSLDGEVLLGELTAEFRVYDGDDDEGRDTVLQVVTVYTALVDIPEDPESGRPAVPQGTKVTHMLDETYTLTSSEGPFVLFPDATFEDARD